MHFLNDYPIYLITFINVLISVFWPRILFSHLKSYKIFDCNGGVFTQINTASAFSKYC